jgi:integrase
MAAMPRPRDRAVVRETDRHGKIRWYVREGHGKRTRIRAPYGTPEFAAEVEAAKAGKRPEPPASRRGGRAGTVQWAVDLYMGSSAWANLKPATRKQREGFLQKMTAATGTEPIGRIDKASIKASFEKRKNTPFAARNFLKTMRGLFAWLVEEEIVTTDPCARVSAPVIETAGFLPWTEEDRAKFCARWPLGTRERLIYEIAANTGLRRGDIARVGRPHMRNGWIAIATEKTGQLVEIPVLPDLAKAIAAGPCGELTFVATERRFAADGKALVQRPMTKESMANLFGDACRAAGLQRKSLHGIRKSSAALAAESGLTEAQLNAWFGWADGSTESATYTRTARRKKLARDAGQKMRRAQK